MKISGKPSEIRRILKRVIQFCSALVTALWGALPVWAGGSGFQVVVVVNQLSSNSVALGNYYCERRQVPPQNLLRIQWAGGDIAWTRSQFEEVLASPLHKMLLERGLGGQIDYVALSMDIPYRIQDELAANSTTSTLFYGFKTNDTCRLGGCVLACDSANAYAGTEQLFRSSSIGTNATSFLTTMITGRSLEDAQQVIDQGVESDATDPAQPVAFIKTADVSRNIRYLRFDNAIFDLRLSGGRWIQTNANSLVAMTNLLGLQTGQEQVYLPPAAFIPGAIADNLTSFGGLLFEPNPQTPLLAFLQAGAAGSYGTVIEPCNYPEKFPDPLVYFYQRRGYNLAESYYQSLSNPYQGLIVGEPLAAPFAAPGSGQWLDSDHPSIWQGTMPLSFEFIAHDARRLLQQIDLWVDGHKFHTITNIFPSSSMLSIRLNEFSTNYLVYDVTDLSRLTHDLAAFLNSEPVARQTEVMAIPYGDRLELASTNLIRSGEETAFSIDVIPTDSTVDPALFLSTSRTNFLDSLAVGRRSFTVTGGLSIGSQLELQIRKTTGEIVLLSFTNNSATIGLLGFTRQWINLINATPSLQGSNGVRADDLVSERPDTVTFNLYARAPGLAAAQIQGRLAGPTNFTVKPDSMSSLDANRDDLYPRNHLYMAVGAAHLTGHYPLDTTALSDGYHDLSVIALEGTSVRTQTRITREILVKNTTLSATLHTSLPEGNARLSDELVFNVIASTNAARIELFSSGGLLRESVNSQETTFRVDAAYLGAGLHPFYAVVTGGDGARYRTSKLAIRIESFASIPAFPLQIRSAPIRLTWPAQPGAHYEVLSTEHLDQPFLFRQRLMATNSGLLEWEDSSNPAPQQFYRVRRF